MFQFKLSGFVLATLACLCALAPADAQVALHKVTKPTVAKSKRTNRILATKSLGEIVATLEVATPSVSPTTIRVTIPVPPNTFMGTEDFTPLRLLDSNLNPIETQIEVVTTHPGPGAGAAVVELIGSMDIPAGSGATMTLFVERSKTSRTTIPANPSLADFINAPKDLPAPVKSLLSNPLQLQIAGQDVFGNLYILDLVHQPQYDKVRRTERFGPVRSEFRHHGWMRPVFPSTSATGTLPHLFGVHAYVRITAGDPVIELDLRIHNGADGNTDQNPANPALYFRELSLLIPHDWAAMPDIMDPAFGTPKDVGPFLAVPLVEALPDGKMHLMPQLGQMHRRIILAPKTEFTRAESHAQQEGLGFVVPGPGTVQDPLYWSWWNPKTPFYFPQAHVLPRLTHVPKSDLRQLIKDDYDFLANHFLNGTGANDYPITSDVLGWAHPYGIAYGGMTGGDGIEFYYGLRTLAAASLKGYRRLQLLHRMDTERMPNALIGADGTPSHIDDWLVKNDVDDYVPFYFYMHPTGSKDPFGLTTAPSFQVDYVHANGLEPAYETKLAAYEHIDYQHLVRYTGPAKALAWIGNDSLAKEDLEQQAESVHMTYHQHENSKYHHVQGTTMLADRQFVDQYPGTGFPFGRGEGWGIDAMTAAYQLGSEDFRQDKLPWFKAITELLYDGQADCTGIIQAAVYGKFLGGNFRVTQIIETSIVQNALFGAARSVLHQKVPYHSYLLSDILRRSLHGMLRPETWDPASSAPYTQLAVAPKDPSLPPYCGMPPTGGQSAFLDGYQQWASMAYGLEVTQDPIFFTYAEKMLGSPLKDLLSDTKLNNLGNRAAMISILEHIWY